MIKLTRMADYGVLLMTELARGHGNLRTASGLASNTGLPTPTVSKVLKLLSHAGLLESQRGAQGGYALARAVDRITVADIIGAMCEIEAMCPTRTNWSRINDVMNEALGRVTLAEMALPPVKFNQMFPVVSHTEEGVSR